MFWKTVFQTNAKIHAEKKTLVSHGFFAGKSTFFAHTHTHTRTHTHTLIYIYIYIHTYIHTHTHTYIYTHITPEHIFKLTFFAHTHSTHTHTHTHLYMHTYNTWAHFSPLASHGVLAGKEKIIYKVKFLSFPYRS